METSPQAGTTTLGREEQKIGRRPTLERLGPKLTFVVVFYVVLGLQAVVAAGSYGEEHKEQDVMYLQLGILVGLALGGSLTLAAVSLLPQRIHIAGYVLVLLGSAVGLSVADERFAVRILHAEYEGGPSSFLPMLALLLAASRVMEGNFRIYVGCAVGSTAVQLAFQLAGELRATGVIDTSFYAVIVGYFALYLSSWYKHKEEMHDQAEYTSVGKDEMELESWGSEEPLNTEFELIVTELHSAYQQISEVWTVSLPKLVRIKLKDSLRRIFQVGKVLKSGRNIHEPIGVMSKQLDSEYKHYLEQNYLAPQVKESGNIGAHPADANFSYVGRDLLPMLGQLEKNWNFDMFFLSQVSGCRPLETTGEYCVKKYGLDVSLGLAGTRLTEFLQALEAKYKPNPYHNSTHAADVLNSLLFLFKHSQTLTDMNELELLGAIIAALGHDVGHPAFNNRYLINTKSSFALICEFYADNDQSVLENMHSALTAELLEQTKLLEGFNKDQWARIRRVTTDMILATDMMKHFDLVGSFRVKYAEKRFPLQDFEDRVGLYKLCIKCADVAHAAKEVALHEKWSWKVVEEFFHQGDLERQQNLEISAYCDRIQSDVPSSQCGFIQAIVRPMYEALNSLLKSEAIQTICIAQFEVNIAFWTGTARAKKRASTVKERLTVDERHKMTKSSSGNLAEIVAD